MLEEWLIEELCQKYGFSFQIINGYAIIYSKFDIWMIIKYGEGRYLLKHGDRYGRPHNFHKQRWFRDLYFLFRSIKTHDDYRLRKYDNLYRFAKYIDKCVGK
jgi:hypothetical protein